MINSGIITQITHSKLLTNTAVKIMAISRSAPKIPVSVDIAYIIQQSEGNN